MGYWHGTSSGKYEERQQQKLQQLDEQRQTRQKLTEQADKINTALALQDVKLAHEQEQALRLEKELSDLETKLDKLQITSEKQKQHVSSLKENIKKTQQSIENHKKALVTLDSHGGSTSDPNQAQILEHERDRLADEYRKLNVYYQALSNAAY